MENDNVIRPIQHLIEEGVFQIENDINTNYAELYRLSSIRNSIKNQNERFLVERQYWEAGINFKAKIVCALGLLRNNNDPCDREKILVLDEKVGSLSEPFKDLETAKNYRDCVMDFLFNFRTYTDSIDLELEIEKYINIDV